ncbi:hypothetical protein [Labrys neptuniae]
MRPRSVPSKLVAILAFLALGAAAVEPAQAQSSAGVPAWLATHVGEGPGQIALPVLLRARALYQQKSSQGAVSNPCYMAMDATRPNDPGGGRFYVICEGAHAFRAMPAGHGAGRNLPGVADFSNGRRCARNFGNAMDSELTAGGVYVTSEAKTSFKGYYRVAGGQNAAFLRTFIQFDGEGETANARQRAIGGHASVVLKGLCMRKQPASPYANGEGLVPYGTLVDYAGGRSNGCTSWSASDIHQILPMVQNNPTTLYLYPSAADVTAVARAVAAGQSPARAGAYWNASCLGEIRAPRYWPKQTLEPLIAQYKRDHPAPPPRPIPLCAGP